MVETKASGRIHWIGGSKGGGGKSMMTLATIDCLLERGEKVLLVECDTSNPDVWKAYREQIDTELVDLDEADGWIHFVNVCDRSREKVVVANTAARNNLAVNKYGQTLDSSLEELGSRLVALWVINRQRDSVGLLKQFMEAVPQAEVHVVRNGYFGTEQKFELYNGSKMRKSRGPVDHAAGPRRSRSRRHLREEVVDPRGRRVPSHRQPSGARAVARRSAQGACGGRLVSIEGRLRRCSPRTFRERRGGFREGAGPSDALGRHDNAFWNIVVALEHYDALFRQHPAQLLAGFAPCTREAGAAGNSLAGAARVRVRCTRASRRIACPSN